MNTLKDFLQNWKESTIKYYTELFEEYDQLKTNQPKKTTKQILQEAQMEYDKPGSVKRDALGLFELKLTTSDKNIYHRRSDIDSILDKEVESKYNKLVARIEKKGGTIVDTDKLFIASDGNINGYVTCEDKQLTVQTIVASGCVQRPHYRVLVK